MKLAAICESSKHIFEKIKVDKALLTKIGLVSLSTFTFLSLQVSTSKAFKFKLSFFTGATTYIGEKIFPKNYTEDWLKKSFDTACKVTLVVLLYYFSDFLHTILLPIEKNGSFLQKVSEEIAKRDLFTLALSVFIAPITEEILFRGYLEERTHDVLSLISRYIYPMSQNIRSEITRLFSSTAFGLMHITSSQVEGVKRKIVVFFDTALSGYFSSLMKQNHNQLITSITVHCINNVSCILRILKSA